MEYLEKRSSSDLQSESWSITTVYDAVYERDNTENEAVNVVAEDIVDQNQNAMQEEVYDEYDGDFQEYTPRYATYSNESHSIIQKLLKKKMIVILVILVACTVGVAIGLSVHFTRPPTTTVPSTTTIAPIETSSARGMQHTVCFV